MADLREQFGEQMFNIYVQAKEVNYYATRFFQMLNERGAIETAQYLLSGSEDDVSDGYTALYLRGRLDLTVEALVLREPWRGLFTERELKTAQLRLENVKYSFSRGEVLT